MNELYFDDQIITAVNGFFEIMDLWMAFIQYPPDASERKQVPKRDQIHAAMEVVHGLLRQTLSGAGPAPRATATPVTE